MTRESGFGARDPTYAAKATMSLTVNFSTTGAIVTLAESCRAPVRKLISCRRMFDGARPAIGGTAYFPSRSTPWHVRHAVAGPAGPRVAIRRPRAMLPTGTYVMYGTPGSRSS